MTKTKIHSLDGKETGEAELPNIFSGKYKPETIKKAFLALRSRRRQPYGADILAGKKTSAHYHGKRRYRYSMMNREMSRIPRIHGTVGHLHFTARFSPHAVKGRRAHPPKAEKIWLLKINKKEYKAALISSLSKSSENLVLMIDDFENVEKTKDMKTTLKSIIPDDLKRSETKKVRAGKGKMRGRKYKRKKGPLVIVSKECNAIKSARNIPGIDVVVPSDIDMELLAPGGNAGRRIVMTKAALTKLSKLLG
ncbi:50S ribosomal protein L4 [Candidatus Aenigmatarchaeota archaeon]